MSVALCHPSRSVQGEDLSSAPLFGAQVASREDLDGSVKSVTAEDLSAHQARYGPRPRLTGAGGAAMIDTIAEIALTGRGGGHFPAAIKWRAHLAAGGGGLVVANGSESEPASGKDAALLRLRPHLVLDGLACAAETVGADEAVVWLHEGANAVHASVNRALLERREQAAPGPAIRVVVGPDRYLSGEGTAIIRSLSGGPTLPEFRRSPAVPPTVGGRPALVHNVETLARVGLAARTGAAGYQTSTFLTVAWGGTKTVLEVAPSTRLEDVLAPIVADDGGPLPQALLVGGYGGTWVRWADLVDLPADQHAFRQRGLSLGAGILLPQPADSCGLLQTARVAAYLAAGSARQCGACVFGLRSVADLLADLVRGGARRRDTVRLERFLSEIRGRGGCSHPDGAVRMVASAVSVFSADVEAHVTRGRCAHTGTDGFYPVPEVA